MKKQLISISIAFLLTTAKAQIGIGTTTPAGVLDVKNNSTEYGLILPKVTDCNSIINAYNGSDPVEDGTMAYATNGELCVRTNGTWRTVKTKNAKLFVEKTDAGLATTDLRQPLQNEFADFDNDGDLDIMLRSTDDSGSHLYLFYNDGTGKFTKSGTSIDINYKFPGLAVGDIDNDGDIDLVTDAQGSSLYSFLNTPPYFPSYDVPSANVSVNPNHTRVALGDFDNDGDLDVVRMYQYSAPGNFRTGIYFNFGPGNLVQNQDLSAGDIYSTFTIGDVDNDGDLDIISGGVHNPSLFKNDGNGYFTDTGSIAANIYGTTALGDIDEDGDLDYFAALYNSDIYPIILYNDGLGGVASTKVITSSFSMNPSYDNNTAIYDFDLDGDMDLFAASSDGAAIFINDGAGNFTEDISLPYFYYAEYVFGDVDKDGDIDILYTTNNPGDIDIAKVLLNTTNE